MLTLYITHHPKSPKPVNLGGDLKLVVVTFYLVKCAVYNGSQVSCTMVLKRGNLRRLQLRMYSLQKAVVKFCFKSPNGYGLYYYRRKDEKCTRMTHHQIYTLQNVPFIKDKQIFDQKLHEEDWKEHLKMA